MHAFTAPQAIRPAARLYRQMSYPRTAKVADAIIINSESLRHEVDALPRRRPGQAPPHPRGGRPRPVPAGRPGRGAGARRRALRRHAAVRALRLVAVALQELRGPAARVRRREVRAGRPPARRRRPRPGRRLRRASSRPSPSELGIADDVVWVGGVPLEETVHFYRAADVFVYPSFNETFGLPILEAMAARLPGGDLRHAARCRRPPAAPPCSPTRTTRSRSPTPSSKACGPEGERLRAARASSGPAEFTWAATAERTLDVYREVHAARTEGGRR